MVDVSPTAGMCVTESAEPEHLFLMVCKENGVHPSVLRGSCRRRTLVKVRRKAARVLRDAGCSLPEIGRILGGRNHTTVMNLLDPDIMRRKYLARAFKGAA